MSIVAKRQLLITQVVHLLEADFLQRVAHETLSAARDTDTMAARKLRQAINQSSFKIKGFNKHVSRALRSVHFKSFCTFIPKHLDIDPLFTVAVFNMWVELHADVKTAVEAELQRLMIPVMPVREVLQFEPNACCLVELVDKLVSLSLYNEDDVKLMTILLSNWLPLPEGKAASTNNTHDAIVLSKVLPHDDEEECTVSKFIDMEHETLLLPSPWSDFLATLTALPADSSAWEETIAQRFIAEVHSLAVQRQAERQQQIVERALQEQISATRNELRDVINILSNEQFDSLRYFAPDVEQVHWDVSRCSSAVLPELLEHAQGLSALLAEFDHLNSIIPRSREARHERESRIGEIDQPICTLYTLLDQALRPFDDQSEVADNMPPSSEGQDQDEQASATMSETEIAPQDTTDTSAFAIDDDLMVQLENLFEQQADVFEGLLLEDIEDDESVPEGDIVAEAVQIEHMGLHASEMPIMPPSNTLLSDTATDQLWVLDDTGHTIEIEADAPENVIPVRHTIAELTTLFLDEHDDTLLGELVWALIEEERLVDAGLVAMALGDNSPVSDWLIRALLGGREASSTTTALHAELREIAENNPLSDGKTDSLLGVASALQPSLFAPEVLMFHWLEVSTGIPELQELLEPVMQFVHSGLTIYPDILHGAFNAERRQRAIADASKHAHIWREEAALRRTKISRSSEVWREFIKGIGPLGALLGIVERDARTELDTVRNGINLWRDITYRDREIDRIDAALCGVKKVESIVGVPRDQLQRLIKDALDVAQTWVRAVDEAQKVRQTVTWLTEHTNTLRIQWRSAYAPALIALQQLCTPDHSRDLAVSALVCMRAIERMNRFFEEPDSFTERAIIVTPPTVQMEQRLLDFPDLSSVLDDQHRLLRDKAWQTLLLNTICNEVRQPSSTVRILERWCEIQDYRFVEGLCVSQSEQVQICNTWRDHLQHSRRSLRNKLLNIDGEIQQALIDGIISDDEASKYRAEIVAVVPDNTFNIASENEHLQTVKQMLDNARHMVMKDQQRRWESINERLPQLSLGEERNERIRVFVTRHIDSGKATRTLDESLNHLQMALDDTSEVDDQLFAVEMTRDIFDEFRSAERGISDYLHNDSSLRKIIDDINTSTNLLPASLPSPRRRDADSAYRNWRRLKQATPSGPIDTTSINEVLTFLDFIPSRGKNAIQCRIDKKGADWVYVQVEASIGDLARPIPQFGSLSNGQYHIVCLWERPGAETVASRLLELRLQGQNVILLFLGRLTERQRREFTRINRERELTIAVLDEILLFFLMRERDVRFPTFIRCALPYSYLNPYTPFKAGDVPPEMFFGRSTFVRELQRAEGSCIVYGGRQLGKSALLRQVQREFHNPERQQYAWVSDIKLIGDASATAAMTVDALWLKLRDGLREARIISERQTATKPDAIAQYILDALKADPQRRIIVLLDEADNFLDADSAQNFKVVDDLRRLMVDTGRRFKVVFAGLHNVQRFQAIPNQPLAHFGTPIRVGPLEPDAARQLIQQPLETLGYDVDTMVVWLILSYTNYHPGLIQLFCQHLLRRLSDRVSNKITTEMRFPIRSEEVEATYREVDVQDRIRERFQWTLALDLRYQGVASIMILDQLGQEYGYARDYAASDILKQMQFYWPQAFGSVGINDMRALLDEMYGLGLLARMAGGRYRLRSPNLVRLMGSEKDILAELDELTRRELPKPYQADSQHAVLAERPLRYSPLTHAQERQVAPPETGVSLIIASGLTGITRATSADLLHTFLPRDGDHSPSEIVNISLNPNTGMALDAELDRILSVNSEPKPLIMSFWPVTDNPQHLKHMVDAAITWCNRRHSRRNWIRIFIMLDPKVAWTWYSLPTDQRQQFEDRIGAVQSARRWNERGIRQRLEQHEIPHRSELVRDMLTTTGGWSLLLDEAFRRPSYEELNRALETIAQDIVDPASILSTKLHTQLDLIPYDPPHHVLTRLLDMGPIDRKEEDLEYFLAEGTVVLETVQQTIAFLESIDYVDITNEHIRIEPIIAKLLK